VHRFAIRVRYGDTDQMGVAYYGNYLRWFEIGRAELMRSLGRSYREIEEQGVRLPVVEAWCRYLKPARYDDAVVIETGVSRRARASVRFAYRIVRETEGELLAVGGTEHCFLDRNDRPVRAPQPLAELLERAPSGIEARVERGADAAERPTT
jgi:acyl-CoA thioester hydrolase